MQRRDRADDEVRPDLAGIVEPDVQPGFETLADNERIQPREELYRRHSVDVSGQTTFERIAPSKLSG